MQSCELDSCKQLIVVKKNGDITNVINSQFLNSLIYIILISFIFKNESMWNFSFDFNNLIYNLSSLIFLINI